MTHSKNDLNKFGNLSCYRKVLSVKPIVLFGPIQVIIGVCLKDLEGSFRYPLAREGVTAPGGPVFLAHARQKVSCIVGLTALRLAFFMGYE